MKIVINTCYGGFGLSKKALETYSILKYGENLVIVHDNELQYYFIKVGAEEITEDDIDRNDPLLVQVVEELGDASWGQFSRLTVKEIPDGSEWEIEEYDGRESLRKPCTYY